MHQAHTPQKTKEVIPQDEVLYLHTGTSTTPQENMITVLTSMTMLQYIHLNAGLIQVTSETILHA
eukprot:3128570-Prorocentrum_lima.AAC.1